MFNCSVAAGVPRRLILLDIFDTVNQQDDYEVEILMCEIISPVFFSYEELNQNPS